MILTFRETDGVTGDRLTFGEAPIGDGQVLIRSGRYITGSAVGVMHDPVTVVDSASINFTLVGQQLTGEVLLTGITHNLLSAVHPDTVTANVVRGDVVIGNATPAWQRLPIGADGTYLRSNGADVSWSAIQGTDFIHNLLSITHHGDTIPQDVTRGALIVGIASPEPSTTTTTVSPSNLFWSRLDKGEEGQYLRACLEDVEWCNIQAEDIAGVQLWTRAGTTLSPTTAGDDITTTGVITGNSFITASNIGIAADTDLIQLTGANTVLVNGTTQITALGVGGTPNATYIGYFYRNDATITPIVRIEQDSTGDAAISTGLSGGQWWTFGVDNSDGDRFKIEPAYGLTNANYFSMDTDGHVGIGNDPYNRTFLRVEGTITNDTGYGIRCGTTFTPSVANGDLYGIFTYTYLTGSTAVDQFYAARFSSFFTSNSNVVRRYEGFDAYFEATSSTMDITEHCTLFQVRAAKPAGSAIDVGQDLHMLWLTDVSGVFNVTGTVYGIKQEGSTFINHFEGLIQIASDTNGLVLGAGQDSSIIDSGSHMIFDADLLSAGGRGFQFNNGNMGVGDAPVATRKLYALAPDAQAATYIGVCGLSYSDATSNYGVVGVCWGGGGTNNIGCYGEAANAANNYHFRSVDGDDCSGGAWNDSSSAKMKSDIKTLSSAKIEELYNELDNLNIKSFKHNAEKKFKNQHTRYGLIAEEVPDFLATQERKSLSGGRLANYALLCIKHIKKEIEDLKEIIKCQVKQ